MAVNTILKLISDMVCNQEMKSFEALIKYIIDNHNSIKDIESYLKILIPYYKFINSRLLFF